ncbi:cupin domain-containing protein [Modestobacter sp. URMC 112]
MRPGVATQTKVTAVGLGAVLAFALSSGAAYADSDDGPGDGIAPIPPVAPLQGALLTQGSAGEFELEDEEAGVELEVTEPTDVAMVQVTVSPGSSTGWHAHAGPSMAVVASGTLRLIEPTHGKGEDDHGCREETFTAGTAFAHPAHVHNVANDGTEPTVVYLTYFLPEGTTPALIPADPPPGC